ncbi:50S ribosomal protein L11 methyltransferase [Chloroflexus sp.]|uniref:50S ribosomal protein L11 methyltransferase n=1 Tax=Chloroflexus sp. TaxID=1904827 RepID=UPI002610D59B|nr:50S ribosomal protein L11 methyltransferase [uncultured Chloroflexus sp.]
MHTPGTWLEIAVEVEPEAVETVAEILAHYGYNGGVVVEQGWLAGDEGPEFEYDPHRPVWLRTYLPFDEQVEETRQRIEHALWHVSQIRPLGPIQTRTLAEEDWANAWKQFYPVMRIGERIVIVPSWLEYQPQPDDIALLLDPGMAFGTGLHPTTKLCLQLLERLVHPNDHVLDLGTGSGILAIAAAKLGAGAVLALDNDPIAVRVAQENVERNQVRAIVQVAEGSLGAGQAMGHWLSGDFGPDRPDPALSANTPLATFDLIAANLIAKVLVLLAPDLAAALKPGGRLVSSGIIDQKEAEVVAAFTAVGLTLLERHVEGEWVALVHTR